MAKYTIDSVFGGNSTKETKPQPQLRNPKMPKMQAPSTPVSPTVMPDHQHDHGETAPTGPASYSEKKKTPLYDIFYKGAPFNLAGYFQALKFSGFLENKGKREAYAFLRAALSPNKHGQQEPDMRPGLPSFKTNYTDAEKTTIEQKAQEAKSLLGRIKPALDETLDNNIGLNPDEEYSSKTEIKRSMSLLGQLIEAASAVLSQDVQTQHIADYINESNEKTLNGLTVKNTEQARAAIAKYLSSKRPDVVGAQGQILPENPSKTVLNAMINDYLTEFSRNSQGLAAYFEKGSI